MIIGASLEAITGRAIDAMEPGQALGSLMAIVLKEVRECHLRLVEIPADAAFLYPSLFTEEALYRMRRLAEEHSFAYTVHLPYMWLDLSAINEEMRKASVRCVKEGLAKGKFLHPLAYILHLTAEQADEIATSDADEREKRAFLDRMVEQAGRSLAEIAQEVETERLCVENSPGMSFEPMLALAKEQGCSFCLDVGHLTLQGGNPIAFIEAYFNSIKVVHLHDVRLAARADGQRVFKDHQPLGSGFVDVKGILEVLKNKEYKGALVVEVRQRDHLLKSLEMLEALL